MVGIFLTNVLSGTIDEVMVFNGIMDQQEIEEFYQSFEPVPVADLSIPDSRFEGDFSRPAYHAQPTASWTNEPHGLTYHKGKYHIFYQKNGNGPYWSQINWGHQTSDDLINWKEEDAVLWPSPGFDQVGIWSGHCVIDDDGVPTIMYTGVNGIKAVMALAHGNDAMDEWTKYEGNPVVNAPPPTYNTMDFRDPYIWKEGNKWKMIIGSGIASAGMGGALFMYESDDLVNWTYLNPFLLGHDDQDDAGRFWEMPVFLQFGEKYLLVINKIPWEGEPARALYWTGTYANNKFFPDYTVAKHLEITNGYLAPTVVKDANERYVAIGIIPDETESQYHYQAGWAHLYGIPRVWELKDGATLVQKPLPELTKLRDQHQEYTDVEVVAWEENFLGDLSGKQLEIKATIDPGDANRFGFYVGKAADRTELTKIYYDFSQQLFYVDRSRNSKQSGVPKDLKAGSYTLNAGQEFDMHLFIDGSVVEIFINNEAAFTTRIFPSEIDSDGVDMFVEGGTATAKKVDVWTLNDMNVLGFGSGYDLPESSLIVHRAWPNPFQNTVKFEIDLESTADVKVIVYDFLGKKLSSNQYRNLSSGKQVITIDSVSGDGFELPPGVYLSEIYVDNVPAQVVKLIKQ
jgi:sucrose-6-phosphate hydrolase SacC (GH32 family)